MTVDELATRREARAGKPNIACACGSQWWKPRAVVFGLDDDGERRVVGWAYPVECDECGAVMEP